MLNNQRIVEIISNPKSANKAEGEEINALVKKYPFSSFLRVVDAKLSRNLNTPEKSQKITTAAIFITDRSILKKYVEDENILFPKKEEEKVENKLITPKVPKPAVKPLPEKTNPVSTTETSTIIKKGPAEKDGKSEPTSIPVGIKHLSEKESNSLTSELRFNIEELKKNKLALEAVLFNDDQKVSNKKPEKAISPIKKTPKLKTNKKKIVSKTKPAVKPVEKKGGVLKAVNKSKNQESADNKVKSKSVSDKTKAEEKKAGEEAGKQSKTGKRLKKEEQVELIENFINTDPQISKVKSGRGAGTAREDLSIESSKFNDSIITENLACIMVKQEKFDKAIDIYKRLIWKFPQKKTYFAAQIEELKKK